MPIHGHVSTRHLDEGVGPVDSEGGPNVDALFDDDCENEEDNANMLEEELIELVRSRSNIERIDNASRLYHSQANSLIKRLQLAQEPNALERDALKSVVRIHQERFYGCLSLPFSLAFFGFFALSAYLHEDITNVYMIESGLRKVLGHNLKRVDNIPQLWDWLRHDTLVPELFHQPEVPGSDEVNKTFWSRVLVYNQLQGPLVIEQSRSKMEPCVNELVSDLTCYPQTSMSTERYGRNVTIPLSMPKHGEYSGGNVTLEQRQEYYDSALQPSAAKEKSRRLRNMRSAYMGWLPAGAKDDDDNYKVFIYPNTPRQQIDEHLAYLYEKRWLDIQTKQVKLKALLLNAEVGRPRLEQYQVIFAFSRGGGIFARMTLESLFLQFAADNTSLATDFFFVMCLIFLTGLEVKNQVRAIRQKQCRRTCAKFWTILQMFIVIGGWILVLCYLYQNTQRSSVINKLKAVVANQKDDIPAEMSTVGAELFEASDLMVYFSSWFRIGISYYHLILMFRFFTSFHAQPRLGVVTSTLEASVVDIVHFLVVLLPTFMAYAISGCFIFGRRIEGFATFDSAIGICFKMAMEGEYDWPALSTEHFWTAALWTWTFMLLMVLLMMNMVLAIVMDVYTENRKNAGNSETVWVTCKNLFGRIYNWRRWISHGNLVAKLPDMNATITRADLIETFPNMCALQLNSLIHACKYETNISHDAYHQNTMRMTMASKLSIDQLHEEIDQLYDAYDKATAPPMNHVPTIDRDKPVKGWLHYVAKQMAAQNHFMLTAQWHLQQLQWKWQIMEAMHGGDVMFDHLMPAPDQEEAEPL